MMVGKQVIDKPENNKWKWAPYTGNIFVVVGNNQIKVKNSMSNCNYSNMIGQVKHAKPEYP
jgi:hypothetical protein